jgi:hypothetical protein
MSLLGVAVLASLLQAQEAPSRSPWDGFAPGSYAVTTMTSNNGTIYSVSKQVLQPQTPGNRSLLQLYELKEGGYEDAGRSNGDNPVTKILGAGLQEVLRRRETIPVKGKKLDCDVVASSEAADDKAGGKRLVVWTCKGVSLPTTWIWVLGARYDVPANAVRIESVNQSGDHLTNSSFEVLDLHKKMTIKGSEVDCVEILISSLDTSPSRLGVVRSRHEWLSAQVPGGLVRSERECGTTLNTGTTTTELVEFKAVR